MDSQPRPFGFRLLLLETGLIAARGLGRAWVAIDDRQRYRAWVTTPPLGLYVLVNIIWGITFVVLFLGLWRRRSWAMRWLWTALVLVITFEVMWFTYYAKTTYDRERLGFLIIMAISILLTNYWLTHRPRFRQSIN